MSSKSRQYYLVSLFLEAAPRCIYPLNITDFYSLIATKTPQKPFQVLLTNQIH